MKNMRKVLVVLCAMALMAACVVPAAASSITRKFNGFHAVNKDNPNLYTTDGISTYANGVVKCEFPKVGAGCWQYITDVENLHFQLRIDTSVDPEFDWVGVNITTDGEAFLGEGTGLSTLIWRTSDSVNSRLVKSDEGAGWDQVANQELIAGDLYTGESDALTEPYEDFRWGDGDWIDFELDKDANGSWHVYINGIDIIRTPYKNFDKDMNDVFGKASRVTLSLFLSNATGVVEVRGVDDSATTTTTKKADATTTKKDTSAGTTTAKIDAPVGTTTTAVGSSDATTTAGEPGATTVADSDSSDTTATDTDPGNSDPDKSEPDSSTPDSSTPSEDEGNGAQGSVSGGDGADRGGFPVWAIVVIAVVVVAGAATVVFFVMKKK
ncbi:MAG: hypothetical protein IJ518_06505 [Clostridia bacterium]|nr:hypothetical protein [Clostridia bacterium]